MLVLTALAEDTPTQKPDGLPQVDISVKTLKNHNEHIFATKNIVRINLITTRYNLAMTADNQHYLST